MIISHLRRLGGWLLSKIPPNRITANTGLIASMADLIEEDEKTVNITLRTIGPSPLSRLTTPSTLKVTICSYIFLPILFFIY